MTDQTTTDRITSRPRMPTRPSDERMAKLPVWAIDYIGSLEHTAKSVIKLWKEQVDTQPRSRGIVGDIHSNPTFLNPDSVQRIRFDFTPEEQIEQDPERDWIDVTLNTDRQGRLYLELMARGALAVVPQVSNVVRVYQGDTVFL